MTCRLLVVNQIWIVSLIVQKCDTVIIKAFKS